MRGVRFREKRAILPRLHKQSAEALGLFHISDTNEKTLVDENAKSETLGLETEMVEHLFRNPLLSSHMSSKEKTGSLVSGITF